MGPIIIVVAVMVVAVFILAAVQSSGNKKVKARFYNPESGKTLYSGSGNSTGGAIVSGFAKIYASLTPSSRAETIKTRLDTMNSTLSEHRGRMKKADIESCEYYIRQVRQLYEDKEKERQEREKVMPEQRRFVAQQRRIMTDSLRYDVMKRDNFRCVLCGASAQDGVRLHVDHIFPVSRGGKTEMSNLRTLCERCNMGKGAKIE